MASEQMFAYRDTNELEEAQSPDPLRVARASLLGARRRLADLDSPSWAARFTATQLAQERIDARETISRATTLQPSCASPGIC